MAPALCAVHCALSPAVALAIPAAAGPGAERWGFVASAGLACAAISAGLRAHRQALPVALIVAGLLVWGASVMELYAPFGEVVTTTAGALLTGAGMLWSARLAHRARRRVCHPDAPAFDGGD
jgi:hypothetical protein